MICENVLAGWRIIYDRSDLIMFGSFRPLGGHPIGPGMASGGTLLLAQPSSFMDITSVLTGGPVHEWRTPPFDPVVIQGNLYGRGSSDDKGQLFCHITLESFLRTEGTLPVNVKCIFEGEEEIGSPHLSSFILRNQRSCRGRADAAVISDTGGRYLLTGLRSAIPREAAYASSWRGEGSSAMNHTPVFLAVPFTIRSRPSVRSSPVYTTIAAE